MYFKFGTLARPGIRGKTCFEAAQNGERTSTTRFEKDSPWQYHKWKTLKPGDTITFWSGRWDKNKKTFTGESITCTVTEPPREINLQTLNATQREEWSKAEGWSATWIDHHLAKNGPPIGLQIRYRTPNPTKT